MNSSNATASNVSQIKGVNQSETVNFDKDKKENETEELDFRDYPSKKKVDNAVNLDEQYYKEFSGELPSQQQTKRKIVIALTLIVIVVFIVLFGTIIFIYMMGTSYLTKSRACPAIAKDALMKSNKFTASFDEEQLGWHHTITFKEAPIVLQSQCPTFSPDFEIYADGQLHSRTEGTSGDSFKINNCQGSQIYTARFGDGWDSNIFKSDKLSFEAFRYNSSADAGGFFVKSPSMWGDDIEVLDRAGVVLGNLRTKRNEKSLEISFNDKKYIQTDLEIFLIILAKRFLKSPKDSCNKYFWGVSYFFMSVVAFIVAIILFFIIRCARRWKKQRDLAKKPPETYNQMVDEPKQDGARKDDAENKKDEGK